MAKRRTRRIVASLDGRLRDKQRRDVMKMAYNLSGRLGYVLYRLEYQLTQVCLVLHCSEEELDRVMSELRTLGLHTEERKEKSDE